MPQLERLGGLDGMHAVPSSRADTAGKVSMAGRPQAGVVQMVETAADNRHSVGSIPTAKHPAHILTRRDTHA